MLVFAWILVGILATGLITLGYFFLKWSYFDPQKRKRDEMQFKINMQNMQMEYDKLLMEVEKEYSDKKDMLQHSYRNKSKQMYEQYQEMVAAKNQEYNDLVFKRNKELDEFRKEKQQAIMQELEDYKKQLTEKTNEQIAKEINDILEQKKQRMEKIYQHFENAEKGVQERLSDLQSKESAAIQARIRQYEETNKETFYKINISEEDVIEIKELEAILPRLRNPLPLRKAIYDIYFKEPVKDLANRVTENQRITGIYKITLISTGQCYIGQSVDIANRWQQHCKRGAGIETATSAKLYPEMQKHGIYNFKFEIIEQVPETKLSEREKYWSEYFGAKVFGYSIKN